MMLLVILELKLKLSSRHLSDEPRHRIASACLSMSKNEVYCLLIVDVEVA